MRTLFDLLELTIRLHPVRPSWDRLRLSNDGNFFIAIPSYRYFDAFEAFSAIAYATQPSASNFFDDIFERNWRFLNENDVFVVI